ncbi:SRPBCC family protein [Pseudactinotalea terrae]|uniref:SRPBCC family protein n=1 Tax=Pseudactinotalea terrae TaxID=1743262 RepID=UPI0012E2CE9C|nr:SRPBCC family protein [Pseudactinotalea terrae]
MTTTSIIAEATIEADEQVPAIRIVRDFKASPAQLLKAHTDPALFSRWIGPKDMRNEITVWEPRTGGEWRYVQHRGEEQYSFRGCFHEVSETKIVQTFTYEGFPDGVALETMTFEDLGNGYTRMHAQSLCDSFEARDGMLSSGMDVGVHEGYAKLDDVLAEGAA